MYEKVKELKARIGEAQKQIDTIKQENEQFKILIAYFQQKNVSLNEEVERKQKEIGISDEDFEKQVTFMLSSSTNKSGYNIFTN